METLGCFRFEVFRHEKNLGWYYQIHHPVFTRALTSEEYFNSEGTARYAAIGHITILEQNPSYSRCEHF